MSTNEGGFKTLRKNVKPYTEELFAFQTFPA